MIAAKNHVLDPWTLHAGIGADQNALSGLTYKGVLFDDAKRGFQEGATRAVVRASVVSNHTASADPREIADLRHVLWGLVCEADLQTRLRMRQGLEVRYAIESQLAIKKADRIVHRDRKS